MNYDGTKIDILVENTLGLAHMVANQAQTLQDIFTKTKVPNAPTQKEDAVPLFLDVSRSGCPIHGELMRLPIARGGAHSSRIQGHRQREKFRCPG